MSGPPRVLVYRNQPLPISETFVYNQSMRLERFEAFFLGAKRPVGPRIELAPERVYFINQGGMAGWAREVMFKLLGYLPRDLTAWVRGVGPLLVHAHFGPDGAVVLPLARRLGLPLVVSFHGYDATFKDEYARRSHLAHRLYLRRRETLNRQAVRVIVQSDFLKDKVIAGHGFAEDKVRLVRHGVDLKQFAPGGQSHERGFVLYVGRIIERKGLHLLIEAVRLVRQDLPDVRLTIIGDGPKRIEYEALARRRLGGGFEFLGSQPQAVVKEYMERASVFCMPSITMPSGEAESLGLVFLEAQAMSLPVVAFRSGGIPEVVVHGGTGLLAEEGDTQELSRDLTALLENPELCDRMGRAGRGHVERNFDLKSQNAKLEAVYEEVLASIPRPETPAVG